MVNERLVYYLESNGIINNYQSGVRKHRGTVVQLVCFESFLRETFVKGDHAVVIFFDLEKAYVTTWRYGILQDMFEAGLRGRLPEFISSFMKDRQFRVRLGSSLSDWHSKDAGEPRGCILSDTLFVSKISSVIKCSSPGVRSSLYVELLLGRRVSVILLYPVTSCVK
jgi:Reverse transcriptase (RNA-dependent DNA polymerase)